MSCSNILPQRILLWLAFWSVIGPVIMAGPHEKVRSRMVSSTTRSVQDALVRHHALPSSQGDDDYLVVLGVGTAMSMDDYDDLSRQIVVKMSSWYKVSVVVLDPAPHWPVKSNPHMFAHATNQLVEEYVSGNATTTMVIVGGHSASGAAAWKALELQLFDFHVQGFLGLDPYEISIQEPSTTVNVPSLLWGFAKTTCRVSIEYAAKAAYSQALPQYRVLYLLQADTPFSHCCFTDHGCMTICPCQADAATTTTSTVSYNNHTSRDLHASVGTSVLWFVQTLHAPFSRHQFSPSRFSTLTPQEVQMSVDHHTAETRVV